MKRLSFGRADVIPAHLRGGIFHLLEHCGGVTSKSVALIISDPTTSGMAKLLSGACATIAKETRLVQIPVADRHGAAPPRELLQEMVNADIVFCMTQFSLAHSAERIAANDQGTRFLSMPLYDTDLLASSALTTDYKAELARTERLTQIFNEGTRVTITSATGTKMELDIKGRSGNCCPGFVTEKYRLGSPPDIEANVSPIEENSIGRVIIDGSVTTPEIGLLRDYVELTFEAGKVVKVHCKNEGVEKTVSKLLGDEGSKRRVLAEFGVGLNPNANLTGSMLTDEGALGYIHFGLGANSSVGGLNDVDFHLDFVFKADNVLVDDNCIFKNGRICI